MFQTIAVAVFLTSILSAVLGMGGGMILMGVYAWLLPVANAMILHGVTQLTANGFRCWILRKNIYWSSLAYYYLGVLISLSILVTFAVVLPKPILFILLGGVPFITLIPRFPNLEFSKPRHAFGCGAIVIAAQLVIGVSGALLDIFFLKGDLNRFEVIATKAFTQATGHFLKLVYFTALIPPQSDAIALPWWVYPLVIGVSMAGTYTGKQILDRITDRQFLRYSKALVLTLGAIYMLRGLFLLGVF